MRASLQLGFRDFPSYNAERHALGHIIAALADDVALNRHMWGNDAQSHTNILSEL